MARLRVWVWLVVAHSVAVGLGLLLLPDLATRFAGFGPVTPPFFAHQAGVFHLVLALGYLLEHRRGTVTLLVTAKTTAFVFLTVSWLAGTPAWAVPLSGLADGAMALVAWWLWRRAAPR